MARSVDRGPVRGVVGPPRTAVGIDLERLDALDRFDEATVSRAANRLLGGAERRWCATQASPVQGLIVIFCCREAAYKCYRGSPSVMELALDPAGDLSFGRATLGDVGITVVWRVIENEVLAIAASGRPDIPMKLQASVGGWPKATVS